MKTKMKSKMKTKRIGLIISAVLLGTSVSVVAQTSSEKITSENNSITNQGNIDQKQLLDNLEQAMIEGKELMVNDNSEDLPMIQGFDPTSPELPPEENLKDLAKSKESQKIEEEIKIPTALTAIFISGNRKVAVINDKIMKEGDEFEGKKVEKIYEDRVEINELGETKLMSLPETKIIVEEK